MASRSSIFKKFVFWADAERGTPSALKDGLIVAAEDAWWDARKFAKAYLANPAEASALIEQALAVVYRRLLNKTDVMPSKHRLVILLQHEMRRIAKQEANRQRLEEYAGSTYDIDELLSPA